MKNRLFNTVAATATHVLEECGSTSQRVNPALSKVWLLLLLMTLSLSQAWAWDFGSGTTVYFDNTVTNWSKIYLRVGKSNYNSAYQLTEKVKGTANLYTYSIPSWGGYEAFAFANNCSWTGDNSIYKVNTGDSYAITGSTEYFKWDLKNMRTFIPESTSNTSDGCTYYNTHVRYEAYKRNVSIDAPTNGTISVRYVDKDGSNQQFTSGSRDVAQTCIITVTATPNTGYSCTGLTINGEAFTSGQTYIVRGDVIIAATFTVNAYTLTWDANGGNLEGGTAAGSVNYGTPLVAPTATKTGYTFSKWSPDVPATMPDNNATYTAIWNVNSYAVTFSGSNFTPSFASGTEKAFGSPVEFTLSAAQDYAIDVVTAKDASDNAIVVANNAGTYSFTMPASAVTVTVATHSTAVQTWTVNYGVTTNSVAKVEQSHLVVTARKDAENGEMVTNGSLVEDGTHVFFAITPGADYYHFDGWYWDAAGANSCGWADNPKDYTIDANTGQYAKFSFNTYTATFAPTTASAEMGSVSVKQWTGEEETGAALTSGAANNMIGSKNYRFTATPNPGYEFVRWYADAAENQGQDANWGNNFVYNRISYDIQMYAKFQPCTYSVTLNTDGGTIDSGNITSYTYGVGATLPTDIHKDNYAFAGWYAESDFSGDKCETIASDATGAKTYYAKWVHLCYLNGTVAAADGLSTSDAKWGSEGIAMDWNADFTIATKTVTLNSPKADYTFNLYNGSYWKGRSNITRASASTTLETADNGRSKVTTDFAANYTFTYTVATKTITVTYPEAYRVTFATNNNDYGSVTPTDKFVLAGTTIAVDGTSLTVGETAITATPAAADDRYTYSHTGWTVEDDATSVTKNLIITANFTRTPKTYTANFGVREGSVGHGSISVCLWENNECSGEALTTGASITATKTYHLVATPAVGYEVAGWYNAATAGDSFSQPATWNVEDVHENLNAYVEFRKIRYEVTFGTRTGQSARGSVQVKRGASFEAGTDLIQENGHYYAEYGDNVYFKAIANTGYTFHTWYNAATEGAENFRDNPKQYGNVTYTIGMFADFTENLYSVTISAGEHGSVSPSGEQSVGVVGIDLTATPDAHYYHNTWETTGGATVSDNHLTANAVGSVTATFTPSWSVRGAFNDWTAGNYIENYAGNVGYVDIELEASQTYQFKVFHHGEGDAYGNVGTMTRSNSTSWTMSQKKSDNSTMSNCQITTDIAGTYRFTFDVDTKKLTVTYPTPNAYTITYHVNGGSEIVEHLTYTEVEATFSLPTPTRSGYWFHGWYTNEACTEGKTTEIAKGTTGNKTFYAKWDPVGYYLNVNLNPGGVASWQKLFFEGGTLELTLEGNTNYEFSLLKRTESQEYWYGIDKDNGNIRTVTNDATWKFYSGQANVQIRTTIAGKYVLAVTDGDQPKIQFTYPKFSCSFSIPALVNTVQSSTFTFTPNIEHFDVTGYELYYTNDDGANWISCAGVSESAGVYSFNNTFATAGTYQLKVVVKNGEEQVGEPFLSDAFTVVEPTINIAVSAYPRANSTVTVTPAVTGLQSGTYHYCWSLLKDEVAQDVTFTRDGETNDFSFTAPAAGTYKLRLEVKPGDNCEAAAIISKEQDLTILGDYIVINMKRDPETYWELVNNIYYYKGGEKNANWPGVAMTFLGKDENDDPWYTYTIEGYSAYNGGTLLFNDAQASGEGNMHQTGNIPMPQTDGCYYVKANLDREWKRQYELINDCPVLTRRVLLLSGTENKYQNVTYTIKAKAIFLPGEEITYTYAVTDPDGGAVTLDAQHAFIPAKAGDYTITLTARNENGEEAHTVHTVTMLANPVTLAVRSGSIALDQTITLQASRSTNFPANLVFTFTVIEPGTYSQMTFSTDTLTTGADNKVSKGYTLRSTGSYTFNVIIRDSEGHIIGVAQRSDTIVPMKAWVKHDWDGTNWTWQEMTYRNDGTYAYYAEGDAGSIFRSTTANATLSASQPADDAQTGSVTIQNPGNLVNVGDHAVFVYDVAAGTLMVRPANNDLTVYRVKSVCANDIYYSNTINAANQDLSFYAEKHGKLIWQHRASTAITADWVDDTEISTPVEDNGVYRATATTLGMTALTLNKYTGKFTVFSPALAGGQQPMVSFTPNAANPNEYYNNYYTEHIEGVSQEKGKNLVATVGNTINHNLSNVLPYYVMTHETNLRYAYSSKTNLFTRTYLANSTDDHYLQLYGTNLKTSKNVALTKNDPDRMADQSNWVYTYTAKGIVHTNDVVTATIRARHDGLDTWVFASTGLESDPNATVELLTSKISETGTYTLRIIYDYKTNRITSGWIPADTLNKGGSEHSVTQVKELLIQRSNDDETSQFSIESGTLVALDHMTTEFIITKDSFDRWTGNNAGEYKTMLFWVSLPYTCSINEIYGFDAPYSQSSGTSWEIQTYRGDLRDKGTAGTTPWRKRPQYATMDPNTGYVLSVRLREADFKTGDDGQSAVRFFFPSQGSITLHSEESASLAAYTSNTSLIQRDWHVMGVPVMRSGRKMTETKQDVAPFDYVYRWTWANGDRWYEPIKIKESNGDYFNFRSGHAYMVQGHGNLTWNYDPAGTGEAYKAPQRANALTAKELRIDLSHDGEQQDKTYVLYRSNGKREYEIGRDLEKILNVGRSMLYSELDQKLASICLSDTDLVQIPLTVVAAEAGEYTLSLSYELDGVEPVLYDKERGLTTLLNHEDYTIDLSQGTYKDRFFLGIQLAPATPTELQTAEGAASDQAYKFIDERGQLRILRRGHLYDAQGHSLR